jgi:CDP-glucose 4,6-dehydratase
LENLVTKLDPGFWSGQRVLVTGHTGFKGGWLLMLLKRLGASVAGYSLPPPSDTSLFDAARLIEVARDIRGDIRDLGQLQATLAEFQPTIVFHLAAQSQVLESYRAPIETYTTNVIGCVNLLDAARQCPTLRATVLVTSDKCYENREWLWPYRENDRLGGHDPYSSSKACAELVAAAYSKSFFMDEGPAVATVRAGNVIGGGDWASDRLLPDIVRALKQGQSPVLRRPQAIRPWQHVLEPLMGYLLLAQSLVVDGKKMCGAWNFGPDSSSVRTVRWLAETALRHWGGISQGCQECGDARLNHEAGTLLLDSSKARALLRWNPKLSIEDTLAWTIDWYRLTEEEGVSPRDLCEAQIARYLSMP